MLWATLSRFKQTTVIILKLDIMTKINRLLLTIVFVSIALISCNGQTQSVKIQSSLSKEQAINIFKDLVRIEPINCLVTSMDNKECIICMANKTGIEGNNKMLYSNADIVYYKLTKFANTWRVETQKPIYAIEFTYSTFYDDFEVVTIKNKSYLYFLYCLTEMGNAVSYSSLNFGLYSLTDFKLTTLNYAGEPYHDDKGAIQLIKGDFNNLDKLTDSPEILKFLEDKASKSSIIYRATSQDLDMDNIANYEKKWEVDNSNIKSVWKVTENTFEAPLKVTFYDKNIFPSKEYINSSIENSKFIVIALFRNNILGYDKLKKKYFPIWVESCSHGCNKKIAFINDTTLSIKYTESDNETVIVDLSKMTYKIILK